MRCTAEGCLGGLLVMAAMVSYPVASGRAECGEPERVQPRRFPEAGLIPDLDKLKVPVIERRASVKSKELKLTADGGNIGAARKGWPIRFAVPIPRGELRDAANIALKAPDGGSVPVAGKATSFWPEGEVKWLLLVFLADIPEAGRADYTLAYGTDIAPSKASNLKVVEQGDTVSVTTGALSFVVEKGAAFLHDANVGGASVTPKGKGLSCFLDYSLSSVESPEKMKPEDRMKVPLEKSEPSKEVLKAEFVIDAVKVAESDAVQVTIRLDGRYQTKSVAYPVRMYVTAYADSTLVQVKHSIIYAGYSVRDHLRAYGLDLALAGNGKAEGTFGMAGGPPLTGAGFVQRDDRTCILDGAAGGGKQQDGKSAGWARIGNVAVAVENLWKNHPVAFRTDAAQAGQAGLRTALFGPEDGAFLDLRYRTGNLDPAVAALRPCTKGAAGYYLSKLSGDYDGDGECDARGIQKTHTILYQFDAGKGPPAEVLGPGLDRPPVIYTDPAYLCEIGVLGLGSAYEAAPELAPVRNAASLILDWVMYAADLNRWYGFVDFGDVNSSAANPDGDRLPYTFAGGIGWSSGNHNVSACFIHSLLTRQRKYFDFGSAYAQHKVDIDFEHVGGEGEGVSYGMFSRHNQIHWRGAGEPRQAPIQCLILKYWLTGDPVTMDGVKMAMDWLNRAEWGRSPILDTSKLNLSSKCGPMNWPTYLMWQTTGDAKYAWFVKPFARALEEALDTGKGVPYQTGIVAVKPDGTPDLGGLEGGGVPSGYFFTYDAHSPLVDYAALTGDRDVVRALLKTAYTLRQHYGYLQPRQFYDTYDSFLSYVYEATGDRAFYRTIRECRLPQFLGCKGTPQEKYTTKSLLDSLGYLFNPGTNNMGLEMTAIKPLRHSMRGIVLGKLYPTAVAGEDATANVAEGKDSVDVALDGSKSSAAEGALAEYEWTVQASGRSRVVSTEKVAIVPFPAGRTEVMLRVKDGRGFEGRDKMLVTVRPAGEYRFNFLPPKATNASTYTAAVNPFDEKAGFGWDGKVAIFQEQFDPPRYRCRIEGDGVQVKNSEKRTFRVKTPNGRYRVSLGVGTPWGGGGPCRVAFEGTAIAMTLTKEMVVKFVHVPVEVKDGELTMEVGGAGGEGSTFVSYLCMESAGTPIQAKAPIKDRGWDAKAMPATLKMPLVAPEQAPEAETELVEIAAGATKEFRQGNLKLETSKGWLDVGLAAPSGGGPVALTADGKEVFRIEGMPEQTVLRVRNIPVQPANGSVSFSVRNGDAAVAVGVSFMHVAENTGYLFARRFKW